MTAKAAAVRRLRSGIGRLTFNLQFGDHATVVRRPPIPSVQHCVDGTAGRPADKPALISTHDGRIVRNQTCDGSMTASRPVRSWRSRKLKKMTLIDGGRNQTVSAPQTDTGPNICKEQRKSVKELRESDRSDGR